MICIEKTVDFPRLEELRGAVKTLSEIAHCLKQRRGENGAVYLDSFEVKVVMGEEKGTANIEDLVPKQVRCDISTLFSALFLCSLPLLSSLVLFKLTPSALYITPQEVPSN